MKKICSLICLVMVLLSMALPVAAEECHEDSVTISEDILACLDEETVDTVFRVYRFDDGYDSFVKYTDMDQVLANVKEPELRCFYSVKNKKGEITLYTYDRNRLVDTGYRWGAELFDLHGKKANDLIRMVDADIVVEQIYYMWHNADMFAIYYETDLGDYVYVWMDEKEYLMALEPFLLLQEELDELLRKRSFAYNNWVGCPDEPWTRGLQVDLTPYDITSPDFNPHASLKTNFKPGKFIAIGLPVLLVALIVGRFLIRGKWKYWVSKDNVIRRI